MVLLFPLTCYHGDKPNPCSDSAEVPHTNAERAEPELECANTKPVAQESKVLQDGRRRRPQRAGESKQQAENDVACVEDDELKVEETDIDEVIDGNDDNAGADDDLDSLQDLLQRARHIGERQNKHTHNLCVHMRTTTKIFIKSVTSYRL